MHCPFPKVMIRSQNALMALVSLTWCLHPPPTPRNSVSAFGLYIWAVLMGWRSHVHACAIFSLVGVNLKTDFLALTLCPQ